MTAIPLSSDIATGDMNAFAPVETLGNINSEFLTMLKGEVKDSAKEARGPPTQKNTSDSGVIKTSLDENLGDQLQEWLSNGGKKGEKFNGVYFELGTTPNVFVKHGAKNVKMIMYADVVAKVTGMKGDDAHVISLDQIAKLPSQLNDPILLFTGSVPNSFVALTEITDKRGNDVVVAVHINKASEDRSKITKIASLYSKTNDYGDNRIIYYVNNQIKNQKLIDASTKKHQCGLRPEGSNCPRRFKPSLMLIIVYHKNRICQQIFLKKI